MRPWISSPDLVGLRTSVLRDDGRNIAAVDSSPPCAVVVRAFICCKDGRNVAAVLDSFPPVPVDVSTRVRCNDGLVL